MAGWLSLDLSALAANIKWSRSHGRTAPDFVKALYWTYSGGMPRFMRKRNVTLNFCYPQPIGNLSVRVRTNRADRFIFGEIFDHRYYTPRLSLAPGTILDLGANIGLATIFFARVFPAARVACVEPESGNVEALRENLRLNGVEASVFPVAVSATGGMEKLFIHEKDYGHTLVSGMATPGSKTVTVRSMSVSDILEVLGWTRIGLLKVDIEGYEKQLFAANSDWLWLVDNVMIEWHEDAHSSDAALKDIAARYGFEPPQFHPGGWSLTRPPRPRPAADS